MLSGLVASGAAASAAAICSGLNGGEVALRLVFVGIAARNQMGGILPLRPD
jgi:hypothetical protein